MKNGQSIISHNIKKSFSPEERYVDNSENRKKNRVGQPYKHRYKLVTDKKTGQVRLGREKIQEGQLKVGGPGVIFQTHAEDTKKETIQIKLTPEMKGKYNLLFNSLKEIRPHGVYWKEADGEKKMEEHWKYLMPVPGETKGNVRKVLRAIDSLEQSKRSYEEIKRLSGDRSSPEAFLAKKYLPKIEKILSEVKELKDYMSDLNQKFDELESKNSKYKKVVGDSLKEQQSKKEKEEWDKLSKEEQEARAKGYGDKPKSWRTTTGSSYNATWTGD